ncbi:MAG: 16S rRNA (guanine(966)-N(2))-methyltransferase RsmD [SAR202 cluster bacterium]|nr:16S rRNA (guanine(966)-N(2))-methyltransferase RsmD [SAR202 cluster bacterium]
MVTRITGGAYRGRKVRSRTSRGLRPTLESVRAAIYSMVGDLFVDGARVLDLFAGTGALGIEALSRGAVHADFVELNAGRCRDIKASLKELGLEGFGDVHVGRVEKVLLKLRQSYRLVLAAPPYDDNPWSQIMNTINDKDILENNGLVVTDHRKNVELLNSYGRLFKRKERRYGDTVVTIYGVGSLDSG